MRQRTGCCGSRAPWTGGRRPGLLREGQHVGAALVGDLDEALFDVDVRRAVLAHRAELHEVDRRVVLHDRVEQVQRADDVVVPACTRRASGRSSSTARSAARRSGRSPRARNSRRGRRTSHREVADEQLDVSCPRPPSSPDAVLELADRDEAVHPHLEVVLPPGTKLSTTPTSWPLLRQVQGRRPTQVAVPTEDEDPQRFTSCSLPSGSIGERPIPGAVRQWSLARIRAVSPGQLGVFPFDAGLTRYRAHSSGRRTTSPIAKCDDPRTWPRKLG